jgi:hypothetical protein
MNKVLQIVLLFLSTLEVSAQCISKNYVFKNSTLVAGIDEKVGAVYKFTSVSSGIDAFITVLDQNNATIDKFDNKSSYDDAWEPKIKVSPTALSSAWVKFRIDFKKKNGNPDVQSCLTMGLVDVDGEKKFTERISTIGQSSYLYNMGSSLTTTIDSFLNITGGNSSYSKIDTNQVNAMALIKYQNVSSIIVKLGAVGEEKGQTREYSLYFRSFSGLLPIPLAIDLAYFTVKKEEKVVDLDWKAVSEQFTFKYEIERTAANNNIFEKIGEINANNNSLTASYHYSDAVAPGKYLYRLKVVYVSGSFEYTAAQAVTIEKSSVFDVVAFPNPFQSNFSLSLTANAEIANAQITIHNSFGQIVQNREISVNEGPNTLEMETSGLKSGMYLVTVTYGDQKKVNRINKVSTN